MNVDFQPLTLSTSSVDEPTTEALRASMPPARHAG